MMVLGVDPGKHGGIALLDFSGVLPVVVAAWNMPTTEDGEYDWFEAHDIMQSVGEAVLCVELTKNVRSGPHGRSSPSAVASLSECRGGFEALAASLGWTVVRVSPRTWQADMLSGGDATTKAKVERALIDLRVELPRGCDNEGTRDAAMIALWLGVESGAMSL